MHTPEPTKQRIYRTFATIAAFLWLFFPYEASPSSTNSENPEKIYFVNRPGSINKAQWDIVFENWTQYIRKESDERVIFVSQNDTCSGTKQKGIAVCIVHDPELVEEGRALYTDNTWRIELSSLSFLPHELGHVLGLSDHYDKQAPAEDRRSEFLMDWIDDRPKSLSLRHLRELEWATWKQRLGDETEVTLHVGDQWSICFLENCLYLGLHNRLTSPESRERLRFVATIEHPDQDRKLIERQIDQVATRGRWDIPDVLQDQAQGDDSTKAYLDWDYIPYPVPRILVQLVGDVRQSYVPVLQQPASAKRHLDSTKKAPAIWLRVLFGFGVVLLTLGLYSLNKQRRSKRH
jgi:hypothetical protein